MILLDFKIESIVRHPNYSNKILFETTNRLSCYARQQGLKSKPKGLPARTVNMVKLIRAQGGCLGTKSR